MRIRPQKHITIDIRVIWRLFKKNSLSSNSWPLVLFRVFRWTLSTCMTSVGPTSFMPNSTSELYNLAWCRFTLTLDDRYDTWPRNTTKVIELEGGVISTDSVVSASQVVYSNNLIPSRIRSRTRLSVYSGQRFKRRWQSQSWQSDCKEMEIS